MTTTGWTAAPGRAAREAAGLWNLFLPWVSGLSNVDDAPLVGAWAAAPGAPRS